MKLKVIPNTKLWFTISAILFAVSIGLYFVWGLKFGIDFTGGSLMELQFAEGTNVSGTEITALIKDTEKQINQTIQDSLAGKPVNITNGAMSLPAKEENFGEPIIVPLANGMTIRVKALDQYSHQKIKDAIEKKYPGTIEKKFTTIGPSVGDSLRQKALVSLTITLIGMIVFIAFAFRKIPKKVSPWKFGVCAVIALFHDIIIPVGIFVVLGKFLNIEVESFFVTALLTIMGFSVHDTIVVFDRIRENMVYQKRDESFGDIAEKSVQQTMARSINTSLTAFITLLFLFLFGSDAIRPFVLTLMIGIVFGTYSSIFIASPLLVLWKEKGVR